MPLSDQLVARLATIAHRMMLTPQQAAALPSAVTVAARKLGDSEACFVGSMERNPHVAEYIAHVCRSVTESYPMTLEMEDGEAY